MPLIVTALGLLVALWRKRRRHAIAMLRKGARHDTQKKFLIARSRRGRVAAGRRRLALACIARASRRTSAAAACSPTSSPRSARSTEIRLSKGDGSRTTLRKQRRRLDRGRTPIPGRRRARARARAEPRRPEGRRTQDQRSGQLRQARRRGARHAHRRPARWSRWSRARRPGR